MANTVGALIVYGVSEHRWRTLADSRQDDRGRTTHLLVLCDRWTAPDLAAQPDRAVRTMPAV
jgi:hypothetical protein